MKRPAFRARRRVHALILSSSVLTAGLALAGPGAADAQQPADLDTLVLVAIEANSTVRSAAAAVEAARLRAPAAAAWPDPMLMLGVTNATLSRQPSPPHATGSVADPMRMNMAGIQQMIPFPGKRPLARLAAEAELRQAEEELAAVRRAIASAVKQAWYDLAFDTRALEVVTRNAEVVAGLIAVSEARYAAAGSVQPDVLDARTEAVRLGETVLELNESRRAALARLNALLERPSDAPVVAGFAPGLFAVAAPLALDSARFVSAALGARAAGSPVRPVREIQALAREWSPALRRHRALIEVQRARARLAAREYLPDITAALEYGRRAEFPDLVSARIEIPIPLFKRRSQDRLAAAADARVRVLEAELIAAEHTLFGRIAELHAQLEQRRGVLALYVGAAIPQAQAVVRTSLARYQSGSGSLAGVLTNQVALFQYELAYFRALADFARDLAELENIAGTEVLR